MYRWTDGGSDGHKTDGKGLNFKGTEYYMVYKSLQLTSESADQSYRECTTVYIPDNHKEKEHRVHIIILIIDHHHFKPQAASDIPPPPPLP